MENATKALIIAGSILIAILLIAMGIRTFNSTEGLRREQEKSIDTTDINMFNSKFSGNLGYAISDAKAKALVQKIIASNAANDTQKVTFRGNIPTDTSGATAGTYQATYDENGYITDIH